MDGVRFVVGLVARGVFWLCVCNVVLNAMTQAISAKQYVLAAFELVGFPATYLLYPFLQPHVGNAWPWAEGHTLIPVLVVSLITYPISTLIGRLAPVER